MHLLHSAENAHFTSSWLFGTTNAEINSGIFNEATCRSAAYSCLSFYLGQSYVLYLFLVKRTHICNAISQPRTPDPAYLAGLSFVLIGFTGIGIASFIYMIASYDVVCHIGIQRQALAALVGWDVFVNLFLTFIFLHHIRGFLLEPIMITLCPYLRRRKPNDGQASLSEQVILSQRRLGYVFRKTFWASLAILVSTVTNFSILLNCDGLSKYGYGFLLAPLIACAALPIISITLAKSLCHLFWLTLFSSVGGYHHILADAHQRLNHRRS